MSDSERKPKQRTPEEKVAILRKHLVDKLPVSEVCEESGVHPTVFYGWLKHFFDHGAAAFGPPAQPDKKIQARDERIAFLEAKLKKRDEVMAELMEEHLALKKSLGEI
jgi:transposase